MTKRIVFIFLSFSTLLAAFTLQAGHYLSSLILRDSGYEQGQGQNRNSPAEQEISSSLKPMTKVPSASKEKDFKHSNLNASEIHCWAVWKGQGFLKD